jgi:hypothetical protein
MGAEDVRYDGSGEAVITGGKGGDTMRKHF